METNSEGSEAKYRAKLRKVIGGWSEAYEPSRGSGVGYPDLQFLVGRQLVPVEVKKGHIKNGRLYPTEIRGSQIIWHHKFWSAGGVAHIMVALGPVSKMDVWGLPAVDRYNTQWWRQGYILSECIPWVVAGLLQVQRSELAVPYCGAFPSGGD